ncbi:hypothetical protein HPSD74_2001 [Glaesserella parasuis D74]|nr:hypothetical protein HPSD74_2001 [Glaesserella parasuis D74]
MEVFLQFAKYLRNPTAFIIKKTLFFRSASKNEKYQLFFLYLLSIMPFHLSQGQIYVTSRKLSKLVKIT